MKKLSYLLLSSFIVLSSCSKDDDKDKTPMGDHAYTTYLLDEIQITEHAFDEDGSSYEIGWVFDSEDGGKVVSLGGLFPASGTYTVTLWDADTEEILAQADVTATEGELAMESIDAVVIEAGKDYIVSYNTYNGRDYYYLNPGVSIFPLELDGITVYNEVEASSDSEESVFPTNSNQSIVGVPEIGFIKN